MYHPKLMVEKENPSTPLPDELDEARRIMTESATRTAQQTAQLFNEARNFARNTWGNNFDVWGVYGHLTASGAVEKFIFQEDSDGKRLRHFIITAQAEDGSLQTLDVDVTQPPDNTKVVPVAEYLGTSLQS